MSLTENDIQIRDLSVNYGKKAILREVTLTVKKGDWWLVLGPNGAGKSTLLRSIMGRLKPAVGNVMIRGQKLSSLSLRDRAQLISFVPQASDDDVPFSIYDFVMMSRFSYQGLLGLPGKEDHDHVQRALDLTDTLHLKQQIVSTLSGGERQRVLLAGAVAQNTPILLLDEPTTWLDPRHVVSMIHSIERIRETTGVTLMMVTHDVNVLRADVTDVLLLDQNFKAEHLSAEECRNRGEEIFSDVYQTPFAKIHPPEITHPLFYHPDKPS